MQRYRFPYAKILTFMYHFVFQVFMPHCMEKGQSQFTTSQANDTRKITKLRWIVEADNGWFKRVFPFFHQTIQTKYFGNLYNFLRITCAIKNAFSPATFREEEKHKEFAEIIRNHSIIENPLLVKIQEHDLDGREAAWHKADEDSILLEFPRLDLQDLELITLGQYQLNVGERYNEEHLAVNDVYKYLYHKDMPGLIRVKMQSRFSKKDKRTMWIEFLENGRGRDSITGYYCKCPSGPRTLGCCSHIAAVSVIPSRKDKALNNFIRIFLGSSFPGS